MFGARPATNAVVRQYSGVYLTATATPDAISVFSFPSTLLEGVSSINITSPAAQLVLINIPSTTGNDTMSSFSVSLNGTFHGLSDVSKGF